MIHLKPPAFNFLLPPFFPAFSTFLDRTDDLYTQKLFQKNAKCTTIYIYYITFCNVPQSGNWIWNDTLFINTKYVPPLEDDIH